MVARIKMPDMWKKVEISWQTLEHAFDLKDYSVSLLLDSLQEADDQHCKTNCAHVEIIDRSLKAHETRLEIVNGFFYGNLETALQDKTVEFENITCYRNKREIALRRINLLANRRSENTSNTAKSVAISKVDAFVEDGRNETRIITAQLQKKLEDLWNDLRHVLSEYRKRHERFSKFHQLLASIRLYAINRHRITHRKGSVTDGSEQFAKISETIHHRCDESDVQLGR
ncbi:dynein regulatory complex subunit 2 [Xylocopa sonorina]|uniref:dynein regulatory complex subunit 2 n=1 Tax=Xylocopa sonorina TaxID=1818115 RepID=UPI00403A8B8E